MKDYKTENLRNVAVCAHGGAGKTSLVEALVYNMGETTRLGVIDQGNTVCDYTEEEIERQISISSSLAHGEWNQNKINIIDTPGYSDFFGEVVGALRAVDNVIVTISASGGVEVGTEMIWEEAKKNELPRVIVINKLDKENINFDQLIQSVRDSFGHNVVVAQFPVETGPNFSGIVDLVRMKLLKFKTDGSGNFNEEDIPANLQEQANELHTKLIEAVAESDDSLMEKYFEAGELTEDEFRTGLRNAIRSHTVYPVFCAAATLNVGTKRLLDVLSDFLQSPTDRIGEKGTDKTGKEINRKYNITETSSALVYKTTSEAHVGELSYFKVISGAIKTGDDIYNSTQDHAERIGQLYILNGKTKKKCRTDNRG